MTKARGGGGSLAVSHTALPIRYSRCSGEEPIDG